MPASLQFSTRLDEIVFVGRNKNYGAYHLRSLYFLNLCKSLLFPIVTLCVSAFFYFLNQQTVLPITFVPKIIAEQSPVKIVEVDLNKNNSKAQKEVLKKDPGSGKTTANSLIVKEEEDFRKDSLPTHLTLNSDQNTDLDENDTGLNKHKDSGESLSKGNGTLTASEPVLVPDEMPEFEGGLAALYAFISKQIHYPAEAREAMKQGKVSVRFIVDENGKVIFPKALNRPGFGLDLEAERVLSILPAFKSPAKIAGKAVKCYFVLPINFKLN